MKYIVCLYVALLFSLNSGVVAMEAAGAVSIEAAEDNPSRLVPLGSVYSFLNRKNNEYEQCKEHLAALQLNQETLINNLTAIQALHKSQQETLIQVKKELAMREFMSLTTGVLLGSAFITFIHGLIYLSRASY